MTTDALTELVDLYPTLADLAGLPVPAGVEGVSQKAVLKKPRTSVKEAAFSQFPRASPAHERGVMGYSVRTAHYRYTEWIDLKSGKVEATELYDHRKDPMETRNLSKHERYGAVIQSLNLGLARKLQHEAVKAINAFLSFSSLPAQKLIMK